MPTETPITYEQSKEQLQAMRHHIKAKLSQYTEDHLLPEDAKAQRDMKLISVLVDEFAESALNRMIKLYLKGLCEDKPRSSAEHVNAMMKRTFQRFAAR